MEASQQMFQEPNLQGHVWGGTPDNGYSTCKACKTRENTDAAASPCPGTMLGRKIAALKRELDLLANEQVPYIYDKMLRTQLDKALDLEEGLEKALHSTRSSVADLYARASRQQQVPCAETETCNEDQEADDVPTVSPPTGAPDELGAVMNVERLEHENESLRADLREAVEMLRETHFGSCVCGAAGYCTECKRKNFLARVKDKS